MASSTNNCTFVGRAVRDAEIRASNSGLTVCKFSLALNGYKEGDVSYLNFVMFGKFADSVGKYITKGKRLAVTSEAKQNTWVDKDTQKNRYAIEFIVNKLELLDGGTKNNAQQADDSFKPEHTENFEEDLDF